MDSQTTSIQKWTSNSPIPPIPDAKALADIRIDKSVPRYRDVPASYRVGWLTKQISSIYAIKHIPLVDANGKSRMETIKTDAVALDTFILRNSAISDFTQPEINDAFLAGLSGEYGDYVGVTAETLFKFLRGFLDSEKKRESVRIVNARRTEAMRLRDEEMRRRLRDEIERAKLDGTFVPNKERFSPKLVNKITEEERKAHREKIREQVRMAKAGLI